MKLRFISIILLTLTALCPAIAQHLTSNETLHDCGQVLFRKPVTVEFTLHNSNSRQVAIKQIETSCGCTTAKMKRRNISSGKGATMHVTFDAKQLGHFVKQVWIYEEGQPEPLELTIKGVVVTEIKDYSSDYPHLIGQIRSDCNEIEFDDVHAGEEPFKRFQILNTTGETIEPVIMHLPEWLKADVAPSRMAPEQSGEITFTIISDKLRNMGLTQTTVYLGKFPGDRVGQDKEIPVSVILLPTKKESENTNPNVPQLAISSKSVKRSEMSGKSGKLKGEIIVQNIGRSTLDITSLQMFTVGVQISIAKTKLEPGEMTKLKIQVNEDELKDVKGTPRILMITNDPRQPKVIIEIL